MKTVDVISRRSLAASAAARWRQQYSKSIALKHLPQSKALAELEALGPNPDPDAVDAVIKQHFSHSLGLTSVSACLECGVIPNEVIQLNSEGGFDDPPVHYCRKCLLAAIDLKA